MSKVKFCEGGEREVSVGKDMYPSLSWRFSTPEGDCGLCQKCPKQWKSLILHKYLQLHSPLWKKSYDKPRQLIKLHLCSSLNILWHCLSLGFE